LSEIRNVGQTWMAKCNQLTPLPFKGLTALTVSASFYWVVCTALNVKTCRYLHETSKTKWKLVSEGSQSSCTAVSAGPSSESSTSSRDCSPSRSSPFGVNVHSPVVLRRGARGYGFSLTAIRVFYGDSGYFTLHHMISVFRPLL